MKRNKPRKLSPRILIVCEGKQTEKNYFVGLRKKLRLPSLKIEIQGIGQSNDNLVEHAKTFINLDNKDISYDSVWCVFDRDGEGNRDNDINAFEKAQKYGFQIAFSVEAFEVWLLLHFKYFINQYSVQDLNKKLNQEFKKEIKKEYNKTDPNLFDDLESRMDTALNNAKKLHNCHSPGPHKPHYDCNPCSTVFELVEFLKTKER
jgi:hypothetical protein